MSPMKLTQSGWQKTGVTVVTERGGILALGQLRLVLVVVTQKRQVTKNRRFPTEILVKLDVLGNRADPLLAADDVRDPHQMIVHYDREMVGGKPVGFKDDLIVDRLPVLA